MGDMKAIFAPDTNFFLQFKPASDVPWKEITDASDVELVVLMAVLDELDDHNHGPNGRRRRAAEKLLKTLDPLVDGIQDEVVVREKKPRVCFRLSTMSEAFPARVDGKGDDAILAEVLACRAGGLEDLRLLTHDRALILRARGASVPALRLPGAWQLPPEPDHQEKKIAELQRQVKELGGRAPHIRVWPEVDGKAVEAIELSIKRFPPLTDSFVRRAMAAVQRKHPDQTEVRVGITVVSRDGISTYTDQRNAWLAELHKLLQNLHLHLSIQRGQVEFELCLENTGGAIATGFELEADAEGSFHFVDAGHRLWKQLMEPVTMPAPPKLRSAYDFTLGEHSFLPPTELPDSRVDLRSLSRPSADSPDFDWVYEEALVNLVQGTCGQFRRGRRPERQTLTLIVPADVEIEDQLRGRLGGWFTADNLAEPGSFGFPVRLTPDWQDTEAAAVALLAEHLNVEL